jgi:hypothetical protein
MLTQEQWDLLRPLSKSMFVQEDQRLEVAADSNDLTVEERFSSMAYAGVRCKDLLPAQRGTGHIVRKHVLSNQ